MTWRLACVWVITQELFNNFQFFLGQMRLRYASVIGRSILELAATNLNCQLGPFPHLTSAQ